MLITQDLTNHYLFHYLFMIDEMMILVWQEQIFVICYKDNCSGKHRYWKHRTNYLKILLRNFIEQRWTSEISASSRTSWIIKLKISILHANTMCILLSVGMNQKLIKGKKKNIIVTLGGWIIFTSKNTYQIRPIINSYPYIHQSFS